MLYRAFENNRQGVGAYHLILFNLETWSALGSFYYHQIVPSADDSLIILTDESMLRVVRLSDGHKIDSLARPAIANVFALTATTDTIAVSVGDSVYIIDLPVRDTISSTVYPDRVHKVSRVPGTDSVHVVYGSTSGIQPYLNAVTHRIGSSPGTEYVSIGTPMIELVGPLLIRKDKTVFERRTGALLRYASDAFHLATGEYVVLDRTKHTTAVVLSAALDTLQTFLLDSNRYVRYIAAAPVGSVLTIAADTNAWDINTRQLTVTQRQLSPLSSSLTNGAHLRSSIVVYPTPNAGWKFYSLATGLPSHSDKRDLASITELNAASVPHRFAFGERVYDINADGGVIDSTDWSVDDAQYAYAPDLWWKSMSPAEYQGIKTFDSTVAVRGFFHTQPIISLWVMRNGASYATADASGRVIEWDMHAQTAVGVLRNPVAQTEAQTYSVRLVSDTSICVVERRSDKSVYFVLQSFAGSERTCKLPLDGLAKLEPYTFDSVLCAGPTKNGSYIIQHPRAQSLLLVDASMSVREYPFPTLAGIVLDTLSNELIAIDSSTVYLLDAATLVKRASADLDKQGRLMAIEASKVPDHVLLRVRRPNNSVDQILHFNTVTLSSDRITETQSSQHKFISIGDQEHILGTTIESVYRLPIRSAVAGASRYGKRFLDWLPIAAKPSNIMQSVHISAASMSADEKSVVMLVRGYPDAVLCQNQEGATIRYFDVVGSESPMLTTQMNGSLLRLKHSNLSYVVSGTTFTPLARVPDISSSTMRTSNTDRMVSTQINSVKPRHQIYNYTFRIPLGTQDEYGNYLQTKEAPKAVTNVGDLPTICGDGRRYAFHIDTTLFIASIDDGRVSDSINLHFSPKLLVTNSDGHYLIAANDNQLLIYDIRTASVIGVTSQFESIQDVRWSHRDNSLFVYTNFDRFGCYVAGNIDIGVGVATTLAPFTRSCLCSAYVADATLHVDMPHTIESVFISVADVTGALLLQSVSPPGPQHAVRLPALASQFFILRLQSGSHTCTHPVSFLYCHP